MQRISLFLSYIDALHVRAWEVLYRLLFADTCWSAGLPNPSREIKFSGTNADREIFVFPVQLTTCRTGNLTRLIHTLAIYVTIPYSIGSATMGCPNQSFVRKFRKGHSSVRRGGGGGVD